MSDTPRGSQYSTTQLSTPDRKLGVYFALLLTDSAVSDSVPALNKETALATADII